MRPAVYILLFFLLLFGGGQNVQASVGFNCLETNVTQHVYKPCVVTLDSADQLGAPIEDADIDIEEEHSSNTNHSDFSPYKNNLSRYALLSHWKNAYHLHAPTAFSLNYVAFPATCGLSAPIYITLRVLRI